ncbi:phospholipase D-like domain-containing protein [Frateuria soli]|uniref:phospholipase D-like domain-containing protein n=1 Tax=Frateuria soli TaxID=1542730 RepID=UPI001E496777|nr:phospholipase D-like domain-containing protein [Frateuria soli]UGB36819.1 phospholipase D-like domain-containing protein [Frateuria soli]
MQSFPRAPSAASRSSACASTSVRTSRTCPGTPDPTGNASGRSHVRRLGAHLRGTWRRVGLLLVATCAAGLAGLTAANVLPEGPGLAQAPAHVAPVDSPAFRRQAEALLGSPVTPGNAVVDLQNGDAYFPAMLADIRSARKSIELESYILRRGRVADVFVAALSERARAGVKVRMVVDWMGSRGNVTDAARLRAAGVDFHFYRPVRLDQLASLNKRTHRKLMVVDDRVAWTGGMGIDDAWRGNASDGSQKRDMMFRLRGPAVGRMRGVFEEHWLATGGQRLPPPEAKPSAVPGQLPVQVIASTDRVGEYNSQRMFLLAIAGARRSIDLEASYFVPDAAVRQALLDALARGVRVRIIVEGDHVDGHMVGDASRTYWADFLAAGAAIARYTPSLFHSKLMVVDGYLTLAGSANFDSRSFHLNDEANIAIYDRPYAREMAGVFDRDLTVSQPVTIAQLRERPWTQQVTDRFWAGFASQL